MMEKLYVVGRADLEPGLFCAQACHGLRQFTDRHPETDREWYRGSNNLVILEVPTKEALVELAYRLARSGAPVSLFCEPDLGGEPTSLATYGPLAKRFTSSLPLALRRTVVLESEPQARVA
jgi:hypothetical protein